MKNKMLNILSAVSIVSAIIGMIVIALFFIEQLRLHGPPAFALLKGLF